MVWLLTELPMVASVTLSVCAAALTSTVSEEACTDRAKLMVAG